MQDFLKFMNGHGFDPGPTLVLDGKIHRFGNNGKKDNCWYIGFQNHSVKDGKIYVSGVVGDWRHDSKLIYTPTGVSKEDKLTINNQIKAVQEKLEEEKRINQELTAQYAEKNWKNFGEEITPYMKAKLIDSHEGTKSYVDYNSGELILAVPARDVEGKLWGYQRISNEKGAAKKFLSKQKTKDVFHVIGEIEFAEKIFLCEGYATAYSVHKATDITTVSAFSASNMVNVARDLKLKYPDANITICGDDDQFSKDEKNAGRDWAAKAQAITGGDVFFPKFQSLDGEPTDFNDLHKREGIAKVKEQILGIADVAPSGYVALGYSETTYFFYSAFTKDLVKVSTFTDVQLFSLAPIEHWENAFPMKKGGFDQTTIKNHLIQLCRKAGQFDASRVRGTGAWSDNGRIVINTGYSLIVDGALSSALDIKSRYVYVQTMYRAPIHPSPLKVEESKEIFEICKRFNWQNPMSAYYLSGWIALSRIAGALKIRPHIWLTGGKGTGKTTVMENFIRPLLGSYKVASYQCGTSEAGIRQDIGSSSVPFIFDEADPDEDQVSASAIKSIIVLCRQSWANTGSTITKGSAGGYSVQYQLAFPALLSSIRVQLKQDADRSRFAVLELNVLTKEDQKSWKGISGKMRMVTPEFGDRLFARSAGMIPTIVKNYELLYDALKTHCTARMADQYGMLLAGYHSLVSDKPVTVEQAEEYAHGIDFTEEKEQETEGNDAEECLRYLLTTKITLRSGSLNYVKDCTIGSIVEANDPEERKHLIHYGISVQDDGIIIANNHTELKKIFMGTSWSKDWRGSLLRISGAKIYKNKKYAGDTSRGTFIPNSK